jgi:inosine-uridine nucleoside N-ribohydrolase
MLKKKTTKKIPVIINCDTGIDDAVALLLAEKSGKLDIKLITTDLGNVAPVQAAKNTLNILELVGAADIPVVAGEGKCLVKERPRVAVHGNGGLGEYVFEPNSRRLTEGDAIDKMNETLMASEEKITIICLSPTTNIAKLAKKYPDALSKIERLVLMAGTIEEVKENEMPYPEFNVATDPEAAEVVLKSGIKLEIVPMEMGHTAYLDWQEVFKTKNENVTGSVLEVVFRSYKDRHVKNGIATHDGCAVAYVTNPELFETKPVFADVKYFDSIKTGVLTMDFGKEPNALTCTKINIPAFKKLYFKCLKKCK